MSLVSTPTPPAVSEVYRRYFDYVWTNLRRLGVPADALEDACHDVFLVVHRRLDAFDGRSSIRTWLFGITRRVAADHRRSGSRESRKRVALGHIPSAGNNPSDRWSQRLWLQSTLDALEPERREAFVMLQLTQLTAKEASVVTGINANTLSARLRAARRDIAQAWDNEEALERAVLYAAVEEQADQGAKKRVLAGLVPLGLGWTPSSSPKPVGGLSVLVGVGTVGLAIAVAATRPPAPPLQTAARVEIAEPTPARQAPPQPKPERPVMQPTEDPEPEPDKPTVVEAPPAKKPKRTKKPKDSLAEQTALAEKIKAEARPKALLELVGQYRRRYPDGFFADRVSIRAIEAHCTIGQQRHANAEIAALRKRSARLADRAQQRCADALDTKASASGHQGNR